MAIGAEMMGAGDGLGYMIMWYQMYGLTPQMWAVIVTISLLGMIFIYMLLRLEKYFTSWKEDITLS
jgi:NitT/TauT family transport system permease protein